MTSVALGGYTIVAALGTPKWDPQLLSDQKQSSIVYDKEGNQIAQLQASENDCLSITKIFPISCEIRFIAVEDKRFYNHFGADPIRIIKSAINNLKSGSLSEGGSTITIQLARNAFIEDPTVKKLARKNSGSSSRCPN